MQATALAAGAAIAHKGSRRRSPCTTQAVANNQSSEEEKQKTVDAPKGSIQGATHGTIQTAAQGAATQAATAPGCLGQHQVAQGSH